ncbi:MAG: hypothetical protein IJZ82_03940 [Lachnospiraceae bacterium]|nr:hypothetical protein [Lachnospiraceae bacterium]
MQVNSGVRNDYFTDYHRNSTATQEEENRKLFKERILEIREKMEKGETEEAYQIGSQSFTEDEWDKFLENFDSIQEVLKELMRERLEKKKEEALEKAQEDKILEEKKQEEKKLEEEILLDDLWKILVDKEV